LQRQWKFQWTTKINDCVSDGHLEKFLLVVDQQKWEIQIGLEVGLVGDALSNEINACVVVWVMISL